MCGKKRGKNFKRNFSNLKNDFQSSSSLLTANRESPRKKKIYVFRFTEKDFGSKMIGEGRWKGRWKKLGFYPRRKVNWNNNINIVILKQKKKNCAAYKLQNDSFSSFPFPTLLTFYFYFLFELFTWKFSLFFFFFNKI